MIGILKDYSQQEMCINHMWKANFHFQRAKSKQNNFQGF